MADARQQADAPEAAGGQQADAPEAFSEIHFAESHFVAGHRTRCRRWGGWRRAGGGRGQEVEDGGGGWRREHSREGKLGEVSGQVGGEATDGASEVLTCERARLNPEVHGFPVSRGRKFSGTATRATSTCRPLDHRQCGGWQAASSNSGASFRLPAGRLAPPLIRWSPGQMRQCTTCSMCVGGHGCGPKCMMRWRPH